MYVPRWKGARDIVTEKMQAAERSVHYGRISFLLTKMMYAHIFVCREKISGSIPTPSVCYQWAVGQEMLTFMYLWLIAT